jgi:succinylglutamate desuccinylase
MVNRMLKVAIVGGTHGNELTGIYVVKQFEQFPEKLARPNLSCMTLLANPRAIAANQRYIDRDLNRCFDAADLANAALSSYEDQRAKVIAAQLGPKEQPQVDVIVDLHSTTANMGLTIILSSRDPFNLRLAAYLSQCHGDVRVYCGVNCCQADPMLRSLAPFGCTIEVGPIAQGVLDAQRLIQTTTLIQHILDYLDAIHQDSPPPLPSTLTLYQAQSSVDYPRNADGDLLAAIHPDRQFQDYQPMHKGDPMFLDFTGETIVYQGETVTYPVFINEAAYYEKQIAMVLTEKQTIDLAAMAIKPDGETLNRR